MRILFVSTYFPTNVTSTGVIMHTLAGRQRDAGHGSRMVTSIPYYTPPQRALLLRVRRYVEANHSLDEIVGRYECTLLRAAGRLPAPSAEDEIVPR